MGENIEAEEDEIELSLGLSIGGAFRKTKEKPDLNSCEIKDNKEDACFGRSCVNSKKEDEFLEHQQRKREMHALRRQEARRKREEKQQKRGWLYRGSSRRRNSSVPMNHSIIMDDDEMMLLESQEYESRVRDRAAKEHEASGSERRRRGCCKKDEQRRSGPGPAFSVGIGTTMQQYPFQHLPFANGFPFPYMMLPCWVASPDDASKSNQQANGGFNNVFHPVPFLRPFQAPPPPLAASWESEHNNIRAEQVEKGLQSSLASTGSPGSTSSSISDYQRSTSPQGGSSSDTRSHSSRSESEKHHGPPVSPASNPKVQSEHSDSSLPVRGVEEEEANKKSNTAQSSPHKREESVSLNKNEQLHSTGNEKVTPIPRLGEEDKGKEKKSEGWISSNTSLPQMPCVSTTGNGPNGKTITGFLYRYTKSEVSIVCVCHGNSFTPAEFVKHAGGTDISHPLKHIVLVPSSF